MRRAALALALWLCAAGAAAQAPAQPDLPAAVTDAEISVSSDYRGSRLTVFGVNPDRRGRGDIVVVVRGPNEPAVLRRKRRVFGLWVNGAAVRFEEAPSFFTVISARPLRDIARPQAISELGLDPAAVARLEGGTPSDATARDYRQALARLRRAAGLYSEHPRGLQLHGSGLYSTKVVLPANAPIGDYFAEVYLFRDGRLVSSRRSDISIARIGAERLVHEAATRAPFFYGVFAVALALAAGWAAAMAFRRA
ncbi:MAG: TIGR02186 family protein [Hyphomonadaceae bacterium]|nr:TIGR02186 family protein [Hyphomonadaceae bacterium]